MCPVHMSFLQCGSSRISGIYRKVIWISLRMDHLRLLVFSCTKVDRLVLLMTPTPPSPISKSSHVPPRNGISSEQHLSVTCDFFFFVVKVRLTECAANTRLIAILAPKPRSSKPAPSQGGVLKLDNHAHSPFIIPLVSHTFPDPPHRSRCYRTTTPISRLFRGPTIP
jgi:hypothetical protein